jgi:hypothetical protein
MLTPRRFLPSLPLLIAFEAAARTIMVNLMTRSAPIDFRHESFDGAIHFGTAGSESSCMAALRRESVTPFCSPALRKKYHFAKPEDLGHGGELIEQRTVHALGVVPSRPPLMTTVAKSALTSEVNTLLGWLGVSREQYQQGSPPCVTVVAASSYYYHPPGSAHVRNEALARGPCPRHVS